MEIVRDLLDTMAHFKSVGIAAPQIGYPVRAFVMSTELNQRKDVARFGPLVLINPTVVQLSGRCRSDHEGCLSSGDQHVIRTSGLRLIGRHGSTWNGSIKMADRTVSDSKSSMRELFSTRWTIWMVAISFID